MARVVDRDAKRLQLVEAAAACFANSGYDATSMNDVAAAAGVSKGTLYDYFDGKEDLFYAVFEWLQQQLMQTALSGLAAEDSRTEQVVSAVEAAVAGWVRHVSLYPVSLEVWAAAARTGTRQRFAHAMQTLYTTYRSELVRLLRAAQEGGEVKTGVDIEGIAATLVGAIDGLLLQFWLDQSFDIQRIVRTFMSALFEGIATARGKA